MAATGSVSAAAVQRYLRGLSYPTNKHKILFIAQQNDAPDEILDMLDDELEDNTKYDSPTQVQQDVFGKDDDDDEDQQRGRRDENRSTQARRRQYRQDEQGWERNGERFGGDDPNPGQVSSQRRGHQDNDPSFREAERRYEREGPRTSRRNDDEPDHRTRGNETDAIADARHMRHGYDGRGRVRNPQRDHRLSGNETEELWEARHMARGYDGRGRVRKIGVGRVEEIRDDKNFEGNEAATGGQRRRPEYEMSREERQQRNRERLRSLGGNAPAPQQERGRDYRGIDPRQMLLDFIEDADEGEATPEKIYDFLEDNGIHEDAGRLLRDLRREGAIFRTRDGSYGVGPEEGRRR